jgi:hypothetical protein
VARLGGGTAVWLGDSRAAAATRFRSRAQAVLE